jgi:hypothetical protein
MDKSLRDAIVARDRFLCVACGNRTKGQVHHIIPRNQGGPDLPQNLVTLCGRCHMLVSPIAVPELLEFFEIGLDELLVRRARVELAIQAWAIGAQRACVSSPPKPLARSSRRVRTTSNSRQRKRATVPAWKKARPRAGKVWTSEEDAALLQEFDSGLPLPEIAQRRGRGVRSVEVRLFKLGRDSSERVQ